MAYTVDTLMDALEENMMKSEDALTNNFAAIRTGKASPALVENITFEYYGTQTRIRDAAGITTPRTPPAGDPAVGCQRGQRYRKGPACFQYRYYSDERRQNS